MHKGTLGNSKKRVYTQRFLSHIFTTFGPKITKLKQLIKWTLFGFRPLTVLSVLVLYSILFYCYFVCVTAVCALCTGLLGNVPIVRKKLFSNFSINSKANSVLYPGRFDYWKKERKNRLRQNEYLNFLVGFLRTWYIGRVFNFFHLVI